MARETAQSRRIKAALAKLEPAIRQAFIDAIKAAAGAVDARALAAALDAGQLERAAELLRINKALLFPLDEAIRGGYMAGGALVMADLPRGLSGAFGFDGRHVRAEEWTRRHVGDLIQGIEDDTRDMTRRVIREGLERGESGASLARQITGRKIGQTRVGGYLGLTAQQADSIIAGRAKLLSGDPALMREYRRLKLRDKRFDGMIRKAIEAGKPIRGADLDRIMESHRNKALAYRGKLIARNEAHTALAAGREEGYRQMLENPEVEAVTKRWQHGLSREPREDHKAMDGTVLDFDEAFVMGDRTRMMHPHDPAGGAAHSAHCFAPWTKIARLGVKKAMKHQYIGDLVELSFSGDVPLAVTPNHPILTRRGWVPAGEITEGEYVFKCAVFNFATAEADHDVENVFTTAENIYRSAEADSGGDRVVSSVVDFHGYIPDQDVDIIRVDSSLGFALDPALQQKIDNSLFAFADVDRGVLLASRLSDAATGRVAIFSDSGVRFARALLSLFWRKLGRAASVTFRVVGAVQPQFVKTPSYNAAPNTQFARYPEYRIAFMEKALDLRINSFAGREGLGFGRGAFGWPARAVGRDNTEVGKARANDRLSQAGFSANLRNALSGLSRFGHSGQKRRALFGPTVDLSAVRGVRRFHYEGPVYNFESTSNVLVANGIVNHNCRCVAVYRVRLKRDGT